MKASVKCIYNSEELTVAEAIELRDDSKENPYFTCISCSEAVRAHKAGANSLAHFEHHERNNSCPYSDGKRIKVDTFAINDTRAIEGYEVDRKKLKVSVPSASK
jgi:hypothetical protein